jgi:hypothetical protein
MQQLIIAGFMLAVFSTFNPHLSTAIAQGSLTPPGPPGPTMKSLDQVEPRTPISSAPFTITDPGSYYLTTNLSVSSGDAITIATNGVTLDLSGFTISSTAPSPTGTGILISGTLQDITIANGHIRGGVTNNAGTYNGTGFANGVYSSSSLPPPANVLVRRITVSGCQYDGIAPGASSVVESCTIQAVGNYGIYASTIKQSFAIDSGSDAINGFQVSDCRGESSGGNGVNADTAVNCFGYSGGSGDGVIANTAQNCRGYSNGGTGVYAVTVQNCWGSGGGGGDGVHASIAYACNGSTTGGDGVHAWIACGCYGSSTSGYGVYVDSVASLCYGYSSAANKGMRAWTMNSCDGNSFTVFNKYNMP